MILSSSNVAPKKKPQNWLSLVIVVWVVLRSADSQLANPNKGVMTTMSTDKS